MTYDESGRAARCRVVTALLAVALIVLVGANLCIGSVLVPADHIPGILSGGAANSMESQVIWEIRLPRVLSAVLLGGALSLSGFLLQTFFNNPIADPFILGVSSGAKFVVALTMIVLLGANQAMSSPAMVAAAFLGSLITIGFVLLIARRISSMAMLIVAGVMVGYICSAATNFLIAFADDQSIVNLHNWSLGSFSGSSWDDVAVIAVVVITVSACVFAISKPLSAFQLGEAYAKSVGVNVARFRVVLVLLASMLSACVTAFAGPVSFVGIAVPHLVKSALKSSKPIRVIPACFLGGAIFCAGCDLIARTLFSPVELSISAVTAIFGAPVVIALMLKKRVREMGEFVPRTKTLGGNIPCLASPELARKRQKALSARAELRAERLLRAESNLETPVETQADGAPLFRISDLSAGYDKKVVVEGVDLEVRAGDVVALIGPNGSGKSTILKTITRHLAPLAGAVELDGREISRWKTAEFARNLAVMLTDRPRTELLTCRDIVEAGRHPYTGRMGTLSPDDHSRVDEAMKTAHVEELAERDFMQISDGQRQRVMLARAIAQDPRVLVLDEPTSYLDIRYQIDLLRILRHLAKSRNVAVIMSIHELELAQKSADKVICVKDGRVFRAGAPEDIFTRETIGELYGLQHGTFNERFGSVEIGRPHGDAHTFVIAGAGTGSAVFRQLIRQGKAFYAGILHEGDIDCELARDLATECVAERAFEPIGDKTIARAKELLVHCARLIVCPAAFGTLNARNAELVDFARSHGIEVMRAREGASEDSKLEWEG